MCVRAQESATICSTITLSDMSVISNVSFTSAAYMQQTAGEELWVVSVQGKKHTPVFAQGTLSWCECMRLTSNISIS